MLSKKNLIPETAPPENAAANAMSVSLTPLNDFFTPHSPTFPGSPFPDPTSPGKNLERWRTPCPAPPHPSLEHNLHAS
ncbi:hypothetical protein BOX30_07590 [Leptospirillum ferriphilum]|uniref:Uncharacterized protein n=2 Tax=Leptospirillum ferriphilum TaxID=178606 RepID=A0A059Y280_9BACT|nr:hypothetical protein Y981_04370 [Leptospirillum ferriphilum YSK]OOH75178.1 hypothetical protein BOX24_01250 [Leptospirillum ferriphilum]OOH78804.1 hypothetical protein BOX30_07590 [Leptospirillum ferriphilum]